MNKDEIVMSKEVYYEALNAAQESGKRMGYARGREETVRNILQDINRFDEWNELGELCVHIADKYGL